MCELSCSREENEKKACVRSEEQSSLTEQLECFCISKYVPGGGDGGERMADSVPNAVGTMGLGCIAGGFWQRG